MYYQPLPTYVFAPVTQTASTVTILVIGRSVFEWSLYHKNNMNPTYAYYYITQNLLDQIDKFY
jgi:hypothetical protein